MIAVNHQVQNRQLVPVHPYHHGQVIVVIVLLVLIAVIHRKVQDHLHLRVVIPVHPYRVNLQVPIAVIHLHLNQVDRLNQAIAVYHQRVVIVLYHLLVQ